MLRMQTDGLITLPPPRHRPPNATVTITAQTDPGPLIRKPAQALRPLRLQRVQTKPDSRLWNEYIQRYHYLGHKPLPGAQLRYIIFSQAQPIALLGFGAAAWQSAPRDRYIGWSHAQHKRNLPLIVNNARFLILPWGHVKNLASMILAKAAQILPRHWQDVYGYRPVLLETFVEKPRFQGTCYKAANWVYLGQTQGRGKLRPAGKQSMPIKDLWVLPLDQRFRKVITR
jgi:Druantia protein DruA